MYLYNMKCYKFARLKIQEMQVGIQCKALHRCSRRMLGVRGSRRRGDFLKKGGGQGGAGGEDSGQDGQATGERRHQRALARPEAWPIPSSPACPL